MEILNISSCLLIYFLSTVLFKISQADVCQTCSCSTQEDTTIYVNCHDANFASINIIRFGLISVEYNGTLSVLDLSENNITYLPADMFISSRRLKMLNLSNNRLQDIHGSILKHLSSLEILNLSNNNIKFIDSTILPSLRILDLSNNSLEDLDLQFHKSFAQLTDLNLSHNKLDDSINGTLSLLRKLTHLDLSYNNFNLLDNEDFNLLTELVSLNLSHNAIKSLSKQQFPESLIELSVAFNYLTKFPTNLSEVKILSIEYNQISEMQNITHELNKLEYLNISGNMLKILPDFKAENLKVLDLSYNRFESIPLTLNNVNYPALENLIFNGNLMTKINFPSLLNLRSLTMRNMTNIERIDENSFKNINSLENDCLNLTLTDNNRLQFLSEKAFEGLNLCMLDLKNNKFTYFAPMLSNSKLKTKFGVDLEGNPFHCNCSLQWMLDDFVPWLYSINPELLNNLRCTTPDNLKGKRMVHWYKWKEQVLCNSARLLYSSSMSAETLEVLSRSNPITLKTSNGMLIVLVIAAITLLVLVVIGLVLAKKVAAKRTRTNRRF